MDISIMIGECGLFHRLTRICVTPVVCAALILPLSGCIGGRGKPPILVQQYILEYPSPTVEGLARLGEAIKVERFSVAQEFNSTDIVYRPEEFKRGVYNYHRWRVNPGDMVADYLRRDLRNAGLFQAVFSQYDPLETRFLLEGEVVEFLEIDDSEGRKAALALNVTLLDTSEREITGRVVFQKEYRFVEALEENTARGLAEGMSRAMRKLSERVVLDIYHAVKELI